MIGPKAPRVTTTTTTTTATSKHQQQVASHGAESKHPVGRRRRNDRTQASKSSSSLKFLAADFLLHRRRLLIAPCILLATGTAQLALTQPADGSAPDAHWHSQVLPAGSSAAQQLGPEARACVTATYLCVLIANSTLLDCNVLELMCKSNLVNTNKQPTGDNIEFALLDTTKRLAASEAQRQMTYDGGGGSATDSEPQQLSQEELFALASRLLGSGQSAPNELQHKRTRESPERVRMGDKTQRLLADQQTNELGIFEKYFPNFRVRLPAASQPNSAAGQLDQQTDQQAADESPAEVSQSASLVSLAQWVSRPFRSWGSSIWAQVAPVSAVGQQQSAAAATSRAPADQQQQQQHKDQPPRVRFIPLHGEQAADQLMMMMTSGNAGQLQSTGATPNEFAPTPQTPPPPQLFVRRRHIGHQILLVPKAAGQVDEKQHNRQQQQQQQQQADYSTTFVEEKILFDQKRDHLRLVPKSQLTNANSQAAANSLQLHDTRRHQLVPLIGSGANFRHRHQTTTTMPTTIMLAATSSQRLPLAFSQQRQLICNCVAQLDQDENLEAESGEMSPADCRLQCAAASSLRPAAANLAHFSLLQANRKQPPAHMEAEHMAEDEPEGQQVSEEADDSIDVQANSRSSTRSLLAAPPPPPPTTSSPPVPLAGPSNGASQLSSAATIVSGTKMSPIDVTFLLYTRYHRDLAKQLAELQQQLGSTSMLPPSSSSSGASSASSSASSSSASSSSAAASSSSSSPLSSPSPASVAAATSSSSSGANQNQYQSRTSTSAMLIENLVSVCDILDLANETTLAESHLNRSLPIKIVIHGFGSGGRRPWVTDMVFKLLDYEDANVIVVDWERGATLPNYVQASGNTRLVGNKIASLIKSLNMKFALTGQSYHLIGFSLGAHVAGFAGMEIRNQTRHLINRITGLDPASPLFEGYEANDRLDPSDAQFVDVIHSNGDGVLRGGFGSLQPMGHVDFYPNGGRVQVGCNSVLLSALSDIIYGKWQSLCNHRRALNFFMDSFEFDKCRFRSFNCDSYESYLRGECFDCGANNEKCSYMGYLANYSKGRGKMYLTTHEEAPFCANQFIIKIIGSKGYKTHWGKVEVTLVTVDGKNESHWLSSSMSSHMAPSQLSPSPSGGSSAGSSPLVSSTGAGSSPLATNAGELPLGIIAMSSPMESSGISGRAVGGSSGGVASGLSNAINQRELMQQQQSMQSLIVAHPNLINLTHVLLRYTKYKGWIYSGDESWPIDKVFITDSDGQVKSFCGYNTILESHITTRLELEQGNCSLAESSSQHHGHIPMSMVTSRMGMSVSSPQIPSSSTQTLPTSQVPSTSAATPMATSATSSSLTTVTLLPASSVSPTTATSLVASSSASPLMVHSHHHQQQQQQHHHHHHQIPFRHHNLIPAALKHQSQHSSHLDHVQLMAVSRAPRMFASIYQPTAPTSPSNLDDQQHHHHLIGTDATPNMTPGNRQQHQVVSSTLANAQHQPTVSPEEFPFAPGLEQRQRQAHNFAYNTNQHQFLKVF